MVVVGRGNPRFSTDVHRALLRLLKSESTVTQRLACTGLRTLLTVLPSSQLYTKDEQGVPRPTLDASYCEAAVSLLNSFNLQLLYEAGQLFTVLLAIELLEEPLLRNLLKLLVDAADPRRTVPLHMQASGARALGQLVASLPSDRRERVCVELDLVPWLCTLLTRETYSPECQKAAVQSLQLLGLCEGAPLEQMTNYLGQQALATVMEAQDATQAAIGLTGAALSVLHPQIDAFLAVHRRTLRPETLVVPESVNQMIAQEGEEEGEEAEGEEQVDVAYRATLDSPMKEPGAPPAEAEAAEPAAAPAAEASAD